MLHLVFALNFENLADEMMDCLQKAWTNPFKSPVVIFPDLALEQWFKLRWIAKRGVLANLKTVHLDKFLFDALNGDDSRCKRLSAEVLMHIIIGWLRGESEIGVENWRTLGADVCGFLKKRGGEEDSELDENRLFDFASMMSELFLQYETTRPSGFMQGGGMIECWDSEELHSFFKKDKSGREVWQRRLYQVIFLNQSGQKSVLNRIMESVKAKTDSELQYISLPRLFESRRDERGNVVFQYSEKTPVFLFWHAGMGQFYRMAIREFVKTHEVYAYVQNPCMAFWEDMKNNKPVFRKMDIAEMVCDEGDEYPGNENDLLKRWGRAGRDNIKLWCDAVDYDFRFLEQERPCGIIPDNHLRKVQWMIAERSNQNVLVERDFSDETLTETAAPSKIREVEAVHSKISRLMLEQGVNVKDILVVAPDINAYRTAIYQVFDQEMEHSRECRQAHLSEERQEDAALYIPFTIIDGVSSESLTTRALKTIIRLCSVKQLSRPDFFDLVRNPVVQNVRGIRGEDVLIWEKWLGAMNVYRDRKVFKKEEVSGVWQRTEEDCKDWMRGVKRLLLARLSEDRIGVGNEVILPYSDINSSDSAVLCRFVECIESLEELCDKCSGMYRGGLTEEALDSWFIPFINSWVLMASVPKNLSWELMIYQNVMKSIECMKYQFVAGVDCIPWSCIEQTLISAADNSNYQVGTIFVNGITFMNFTLNRIIPVKHLFFLGMDAASFPGRNAVNSLDLRLSELWPGDSNLAQRNRYAFLCQFMSTSDGFHMSYVNKNLKKDEDFFPSGVLNELRNYAGIDKEARYFWKENRLMIDETRDWQELFTGRECRNRDIFEFMTRSRDVNENISHSSVKCTVCGNTEQYPERVSFWQVRKYLEDPFQFRVASLLCADIDDVDPEKVMYEPIDIATYYYADLVRMLALLELRVDISPDECVSRQRTLFWQFEAGLKEQGLMPDGLYGDILYHEIMEYKDAVVKQIAGDQLVRIIQDRKSEITISQDLGNGISQKWVLRGILEPHNDACDLVVSVSLSDSKNDKCYIYVRAYVSALVMLVEYGQKNPEEWNISREIELWICCAKGTEKLNRVLNMSPADADQVLKDVYRCAYIDKLYEAAPLKLVESSSNSKNEMTSLDMFIDKLEGKYGEWAYFKKADLFDKKKDIGYDDMNFQEQWQTVQERQLNFVKYLQMNRKRKNDK